MFWNRDCSPANLIADSCEEDLVGPLLFSCIPVDLEDLKEMRSPRDMGGSGLVPFGGFGEAEIDMLP